MMRYQVQGWEPGSPGQPVSKEPEHHTLLVTVEQVEGFVRVLLDLGCRTIRIHDMRKS